MVQHYSLEFPVWLTLVSLVFSVVLMLVGTRVLGETNWAPISALANLMQAVFAALAPGSMRINMIGSGMSGTVAAHEEHLMQDYKAGKIVGANYRHLTIVQLSTDTCLRRPASGWELIPGYSIMPMVPGGIAGYVWAKRAPKSERTYSTPLASGFSAGEALLVLLFSLLAVFGVRA